RAFEYLLEDCRRTISILEAGKADETAISNKWWLLSNLVQCAAGLSAPTAELADKLGVSVEDLATPIASARAREHAARKQGERARQEEFAKEHSAKLERETPQYLKDARKAQAEQPARLLAESKTSTDPLILAKRLFDYQIPTHVRWLFSG